MKRRLLNLLTALSLLLCVAVAALWVRSYRVIETWIFDPGPNGYSLASCHGDLLLKVVRDAPPGTLRWRHSADDARIGRYVMARTDRRLPGGFWWERGSVPGGVDNAGVLRRYPYASLILPHWSLFVGTALLPSLWLISRVRQHRRHVPGRCPACGYDLRATPDRCPECGAAGNKIVNDPE